MGDASENSTPAAAALNDPGPVKNTFSVVPARKEPPPEKPHEVRRRSLIILSFWLVVICLGLPIWWHTTAIPRANLPIDAMNEWADGRACRPVFPLRVAIQASTLPEQDAQNLLRQTQHALDDLNDFSWHHLRLELAPSTDTETATDAVPAGNEEAELALTIRLVPGEPLSSSLHPHLAILDIKHPANMVPTASSSSSPLATFIASQLRSTFIEEQAIISSLLSASASTYQAEQRPSSVTPELADLLSKRTARSLRYSPTYHLTFSLFTSGPAPSTWDIEAAIDSYMKPVLDVLKPIHNFTIDTQVQLYATPGAQSHVLNKEDLASFINAAEWPLSPSIGSAPTVNFVTYVGNQTIAFSEDSETTSQSWTIPQWGTVYLLSLPPRTSEVSVEALKRPLLTFTAHLLSLLGTPDSGSLSLRLSTLARVRSADLLLRASSSLGSLARLSLALPSISIPSSVADGVAKTISHLEAACKTLGGAEGLEHARIAEQEAERAFFEKSMVGQLYFPDEHKIAVYLPLLGPVGVPLVMGLINEFKLWRKRRREAAPKT